MYLYNVSIIVEKSEEDTLVKWLENFLAGIGSYKLHFLHMMDSPHEGETYCIQGVFDAPSTIEEFKQDAIAEIHKHIQSHHAQKAFIFDSVMRYIKH